MRAELLAARLAALGLAVTPKGQPVPEGGVGMGEIEDALLVHLNSPGRAVDDITDVVACFAKKRKQAQWKSEVARRGERR